MDRNTEQGMKERIAWYVGKLEGLGENRDDERDDCRQREVCLVASDWIKS
jgi:hypothetical protein